MIRIALFIMSEKFIASVEVCYMARCSSKSDELKYKLHKM